MAVKNGIGYSPLTDKVYLGKQNTEKRLWVGDKKDITNEFLAVASEFFKENTVRDIGRSNGESNLFINIKNDKSSIEKVIKNLTKCSLRANLRQKNWLCDGGFYAQSFFKTAIAKPVLPAGAVNLAVFLIWK